MKAVVLEIRKNEAAVLCGNGQIVKIRKKNLAVGDTIEISDAEICPDRKTVIYKKLRQYGAVAAAVAILLGFGGNHVYNTAIACSYVSLDINPSIEYALNRQDCVLEVTAVNDDAEEIVEQLKEEGIKKKSVSEAMQMTAELLRENGYITDEETDYILVSVTSGDDKRSADLEKKVTGAFDDMNKNDEDNIHLTVTESTVSERKEARDLGISTGRYSEICATDDKDVSKYKDIKVKELLQDSGKLKADSEEENNINTSEKTENISKPENKRKSVDTDQGGESRTVQENTDRTDTPEKMAGEEQQGNSSETVQQEEQQNNTENRAKPENSKGDPQPEISVQEYNEEGHSEMQGTEINGDGSVDISGNSEMERR